jgi:hypothetical protein
MTDRPLWPYEIEQLMMDEARVECFSGKDPTDIIHEGRIVGFTEAPTARVQKDDGQIVSWVIGLIRKQEKQDGRRYINGKELLPECVVLVEDAVNALRGIGYFVVKIPSCTKEHGI